MNARFMAHPLRALGAAWLVMCPPLAPAEPPAFSELERAWLSAAAPVLVHARAQRLPLDIVVQPRARRGDAPVALGYVDGRCKLVLSLRGNPDAEALLAHVAPAQADLLREAMAAHEVGHCWRYVQREWHTLPSGLIDTGAGIEPAEPPLPALGAMRRTRREEGYADLYALAWTAARHPHDYAWVHAWFWSVRDEPGLPGSHHDTRAWLRLVRERARFGSDGSPFAQVAALWRDGLLEDD